jgi:hypothetical protein
MSKRKTSSNDDDGPQVKKARMFTRYDTLMKLYEDVEVLADLKYGTFVNHDEFSRVLDDQEFDSDDDEDEEDHFFPTTASLSKMTDQDKVDRVREYCDILRGPCLWFTDDVACEDIK